MNKEKDISGFYAENVLKYNWDVEIRKLMEQFCFSDRKISEVINKVKASINGKESNATLYERAWRIFKNML